MTQTKRILIAEDDEADVVLMQIVFEKCGIGEQVMVTRDGEETLDYLHCRGKYLGASELAPTLVLLDLKMPKLSGLEVLKQIRSDARLKTTPIVIFTSSLDGKDKAECLAGGADEFVIKPINFEAYAAELERIVCAYVAS